MLKTGLLTSLILLAVAVGSSACGGPPETQNAAPANVDRSSDAIQSNPEELGLLIKIPFESDEIDDIAWKQDADTKAIIAVIRLTPDGIKRANSEIFKGQTVGRGAIDVRSWFPKELITNSEMNGDADLEGAMLPIDAFVQPPFTKGRIIKIDNTDHYVIEFSAE